MSHQEYPKWVKVGELEPVLVQSAEEEAQLTGKSQASLEKAAAEAEKADESTEEDLRAELEKKLTEKGTAVTEADMAELTDMAQKLQVKRGPGRPRKDAAADAKK